LRWARWAPKGLAGHGLAYMSNESGAQQVYVEAFPQKGGKRQVSIGRGGYPAWSRNANELFFCGLCHESQLMVASYRAAGDSFVLDEPRILEEDCRLRHDEKLRSGAARQTRCRARSRRYCAGVSRQGHIFIKLLRRITASGASERELTAPESGRRSEEDL